jgi:hypothetical protein
MDTTMTATMTTTNRFDFIILNAFLETAGVGTNRRSNIDWFMTRLRIVYSKAGIMIENCRKWGAAIRL